MEDVLNEYPMTVRTAGGGSEEVTLRLPSLRQIPAYMDILGDFPAQAEFLCGQEQGWADGIADDSVYEICDKGAELMRPRVTAWLDRQAASNENLRPVLDKIKATREAQERLLPGSH